MQQYKQDVTVRCYFGSYNSIALMNLTVVYVTFFYINSHNNTILKTISHTSPRVLHFVTRPENNIIEAW